MENATKALSIAGGMILAILVISLVVYGWNKITNYQKVQEATQTTQQITKFNKEFESYNKGVVRGYQLISLANLVNDTNTQYSAVEGYKQMGLYAMLCIEPGATGYTAEKNTWNKSAKLPGATNLSPVTISGISYNKYFNIIDYVENYFDTTNASQQITNDEKKQFKELYFDCTEVDYDNTTGRVIRFVFEEIFKTNS